jgi:hypothetical protein
VTSDIINPSEEKLVRSAASLTTELLVDAAALNSDIVVTPVINVGA